MRMNITFHTMTRKFAEELVRWRYESPYDIYGYSPGERSQAVDYLAAEESGIYAVTQNGEMIAFRSFGKDGQVPGGEYDDAYMDTGGGLRPDFTGQGRGPEIIRAGLVFGSQKYGVKRFRVTIADFNTRAKRACEKVGFSRAQRFLRSKDGRPFSIYTIELEI